MALHINMASTDPFFSFSDLALDSYHIWADFILWVLGL